MSLAARQGELLGLPQLTSYIRRLPRPPWWLAVTVYLLVSLVIASSVLFRMRFQSYLSGALFALPAFGTVLTLNKTLNATDDGQFSTDPFKIWNITATNITASFIGYGARTQAIYVPDSNGTIQDVVVGYDDPRTYLHDTETNHTYFGATVGVYANRIKNGTFSIDGNTYHIPENENGGLDTLHGGFVGYDQRNWTVSAYTNDSITFTLLDPGWQHFPGVVLTHVTFTVGNEVTPTNPKGLPQLTSRIVSMSLTEKTPIMLANHIYWNLDAFQVPTILNETLHMPLAKRYVQIDTIEIPNGTIGELDVSYNGALDYTSPKQVGVNFDETLGACGYNCSGVDTCFINTRHPYYEPNAVVPIIHLSSPETGITLDVATNQVAHQIYTCNNQNGTIPIKDSVKRQNEAAGKGGVDYIDKYACIVIETEGWIDAINYPEWGQQQIFAPYEAPTVNLATYQFGTL